MALAERRRQYEAMCQAKSSESLGSPTAPLKSRPSAVAERMRQRFGTRDSTASAKPSLPKRKLANISEQRVLKAGLRVLNDEFVVARNANILELPRRPDGSFKIMQASFFQRLFSGKIEVKGSLESDIAAAQPDLRHLSMEQLLAVRFETLDFQTESERHSAHNNFLNTVDQHLFEKVTRRCCELDKEGLAPVAAPQGLYSVGLRIALTLGAAKVLADGWDVKPEQPAEEVPALPMSWLIRLDDQLWKGSQFGVLSTVDFSFKVVPQNLDFSRIVVAEDRLALVQDRSSGSGPTRMTHWEIAILDPHGPGPEIVAEIERRCSPLDGAGRKLTNDLSQTIQKMRTRSSLVSSGKNLGAVSFSSIRSTVTSNDEALAPLPRAARTESEDTSSVSSPDGKSACPSFSSPEKSAAPSTTAGSNEDASPRAARTESSDTSLVSSPDGKSACLSCSSPEKSCFADPTSPVPIENVPKVCGDQSAILPCVRNAVAQAASLSASSVEFHSSSQSTALRREDCFPPTTTSAISPASELASPGVKNSSESAAFEHAHVANSSLASPRPDAHVPQSMDMDMDKKSEVDPGVAPRTDVVTAAASQENSVNVPLSTHKATPGDEYVSFHETGGEDFNTSEAKGPDTASSGLTLSLATPADASLVLAEPVEHTPEKLSEGRSGASAEVDFLKPATSPVPTSAASLVQFVKDDPELLDFLMENAIENLSQPAAK